MNSCFFFLHITLQIILSCVNELPHDSHGQTFQISAVPALCRNVTKCSSVQVKRRALSRSNTFSGRSMELFLKGKDSSAPWLRQNSALNYFNFTSCLFAKGLHALEVIKETSLTQNTWAKIYQ